MTTFPTIAAPSISTPTTLSNPALSSKKINGMRTTRAKYTRIIRGWSLKWNALSDTQLGTLLTFWDTVKGGSASFQWTDEFGNNYTVRFKEGEEIKHESVSGDHSSVSFNLEEV